MRTLLDVNVLITLLDSEDEAEAKTWGTVKVSWEIG